MFRCPYVGTPRKSFKLIKLYSFVLLWSRDDGQLQAGWPKGVLQLRTTADGWLPAQCKDKGRWKVEGELHVFLLFDFFSYWANMGAYSVLGARKIQVNTTVT